LGEEGEKEEVEGADRPRRRREPARAVVEAGERGTRRARVDRRVGENRESMVKEGEKGRRREDGRWEGKGGSRGKAPDHLDL